MRTTKAKKLKEGMCFLGRVIPNSQSAGVDGIEIDDPSGQITSVVFGGTKATSMCILVDGEEVEIDMADKVAVE